MSRLSLRFVLTAAAVTGMTVAFAASASADLTTRCDGEGGAVTIPTDLVVPRGASCVLTGTVIQGDVRVAPDADLITSGVTIEGDIRVTGNAYLEMEESSVDGRIIQRAAFGSFLSATAHGDDIDARSGSGDYAGFVITDDADASGDVKVFGGELLLENSEVAGDVIARDGLYADVYDTFIDGELRSLRNEDGSIVCSSAIQGASVFRDNGLTVQLGGDAVVTCEGSSYWGSDVRVAGTMGETWIDDNIVNGNLRLSGNDPVATLGDGNMVRGDVIGDFQPATANLMSKSQAKAEVQADTNVARADVERMVAPRRSAALADAASAGDAF